MNSKKWKETQAQPETMMSSTFVKLDDLSLIDREAKIIETECHFDLYELQN